MQSLSTVNSSTSGVKSSLEKASQFQEFLFPFNKTQVLIVSLIATAPKFPPLPNEAQVHLVVIINGSLAGISTQLNNSLSSKPKFSSGD